MAQYTVTFSCGHTETIALTGRIKDRERKIAWFEQSGICSACWQVEKDAEKLAALEAAKARVEELSLPELQGSEKQVAWAMTLRDKFIMEVRRCEAAIEKCRLNREYIEGEADFYSRLLDILFDRNLEHDEARWWIDTRDRAISTPSCVDHTFSHGFGDYFRVDFFTKSKSTFVELSENISQLSDEELYDLMVSISRGEMPRKGKKDAEKETETRDVAAVKEAEAVAKAKAEAEIEATAARTVRPENPKTGTAKITRETKSDGVTRVAVETPEFSETVRAVAKRMGFTWGSKKWVRDYDVSAETIENRIVEIAVTILAEGYAVELPDAVLAERTQKGEYEPLNTRIVKNLIAEGRFMVKWSRADGDFYSSAVKLPGAKWDSSRGCMLVPSTSFAEVKDFAARFEFEMSAGAKELAERAAEIYKKSLVSDAKPIVKKKPRPLGDKPEKLEIPENVGIDPELLDEGF